MRKTFKVDEFRDMMNQSIAQAESRDARGALCFALEEVLFRTGNYHGFRYLEQPESPEHYKRHYF